MNRPRAVDFLDTKEEEIGSLNENANKNISEEEPLVIGQESPEENGDEQENHEQESEGEDEKTVDTLPSGAISKGKKMFITILIIMFRRRRLLE